jgi:hypothetical protein
MWQNRNRYRQILNVAKQEDSARFLMWQNRNRFRQILNVAKQEQTPPDSEYGKTGTDTARF